MKHLGPKRRKAFRLAVYAMTVVLLITTLISIWFEFGASIALIRKSDITTYSRLDLDVGRTRLVIRYTPRGGYELFTPIPQPGWDAGWSASRIHRYPYQPGSPFAPKHQWWGAPSYWRGHGIPSGPINEVDIPLAYSSAILVLLCALMMRKNRKRCRIGHCPTCNYNLAGLESTTCPECGATHA